MTILYAQKATYWTRIHIININCNKVWQSRKNKISLLISQDLNRVEEIEPARDGRWKNTGAWIIHGKAQYIACGVWSLLKACELDNKIHSVQVSKRGEWGIHMGCSINY